MKTPILCASEIGLPRLTRELLRRGALRRHPPRLRRAVGLTSGPFFTGADARDMDRVRETTLQLACHSGGLECLQILLGHVAERWGPGLPDWAAQGVDHWPPLHCTRGADTGPWDRSPRDRIHSRRPRSAVAVLGQREGMVKALLGAGVDVNARNKHGQTALHMAVRRDCVGLARLLLDAGAEPGVRDLFNTSPLEAAARRRSLRVAALLKSCCPEEAQVKKRGRRRRRRRRDRAAPQRGAGGAGGQ